MFIKRSLRPMTKLGSARYSPKMPSTTFRLSFGGVAMVRFKVDTIDMCMLQVSSELELQ
jgi:hypothetical protein